MCISHKFPGDTDAEGLAITLREPLTRVSKGRPGGKRLQVSPEARPQRVKEAPWNGNQLKVLK